MTLALIILDSIFDNITALPLYALVPLSTFTLRSLAHMVMWLSISVFRAICAKLHEIVSACFPARGASHLVLRSFLFVKFICPALVSPDAFGLKDCASSSVQCDQPERLSTYTSRLLSRSAFTSSESNACPAIEDHCSRRHGHKLWSPVPLSLTLRVLFGATPTLLLFLVAESPTWLLSTRSYSNSQTLKICERFWRPYWYRRQLHG
jgi:hypothetical protein